MFQDLLAAFEVGYSKYKRTKSRIYYVYRLDIYVSNKKFK